MATTNYPRVANSPYPKGSAEDRKLSVDSQARSARNRAAFTQGVRDVVTGRAAVEGVKVIGRGISSIYKNAAAVERRHAKLTGYKK